MTTRKPQAEDRTPPPAQPQTSKSNVIPLRPPSRWHDPLKLIQTDAPSTSGRIVLWVVSVLVLTLIVWAAFGRLDIIATADGKLAAQTLVKIVQPAESGVVKQLLVDEGDHVRSGQVLAKLDTTLARADQTGVASDLATQQMQVRRIEAELANRPMLTKVGDDPTLYAQVQRQYAARKQAFSDALDQEKSLLSKLEHEKKSATEIQAKLQQTLPAYQQSAAAYAKLEQEGFMGKLVAADKQREATEKAKDLDAQQSTVAALSDSINAQRQRIIQMQSGHHSELQKELAEVRARIGQLQPSLDKTMYKTGLMELKAPQDGIIKDLATTTVGAVVQPGTVVMTLVPTGEQLFADVNIKNEDVGFVQVGQKAQIKFAAYPFQRHGMVQGKVIHISADASETNKAGSAGADGGNASDGNPANTASYKARIWLDHQTLQDPQGSILQLTPGMQVVAEINQGQRTVLEYLLSPVRKAVQEAGRER